MKRFIPMLLLVLLACMSLACKAAARLLDGETATPTLTHTPRPTQTPLPPTATPIPTSTPDTCPNGECIVACVNKLDAIVDSNQKPPRFSFDSDEEYILVTYEIDGNEIGKPKLGRVASSLKTYQNDSTAQKQIWDYFAAIIPLDQRNFLTHYRVFTDGEENILASVSQSQNSADQWELSVDLLDSSNPKDLTFTLIHEFGHLLTLNPDQVTPSQAIFDNPESDSIYSKEEKACQAYFPGEGCSQKDSYVNLFYERFWDNKLYEEWLKIDAVEDPDVFDSKIESFYKKYKDRFVTDYAPTSPLEDIAESWSYFVLKPKPAEKTIANKKVLFFYEFPELVQLRQQIANNLCGQLEK